MAYEMYGSEAMAAGGGAGPVGAGQIGYNAVKINTLMSNFGTAYTRLGQELTKNYETLKPILRKEWVGEDELDFEKKLVERLNNLYYNAGLLTQAGINLVRNVAESWKSFQSKNVFGGEGTQVEINVTFNDVTVTPKETLISFITQTYGANVNRGLTNGTGSYTAIIEALESFKTQSQTCARNFTTEFDVNSAFFGGTEQGIKNFFDHLEECLASVITAIKDFVDGLNNLANTNYASATSAVSEYATTSKSEIDQLTSDSVGSSRWNA